MAEIKQTDPNAKTDATKRKEFEAKQAKQREEQAEKDRQEADRVAQRAGGTGMASEVLANTDRKIDPQDPHAVGVAEFKSTRYVVVAAEGVRPNDLLDPAYWTHLGGKFKPWDELMVRAKDSLWYARAIVMETGRNWAKVHLEHVEHLTTAEVAITQADAMSPYELKYRGSTAQWSVIRKHDREVMHEGSATIDAALTWLKGHLKIPT